MASALQGSSERIGMRLFMKLPLHFAFSACDKGVTVFLRALLCGRRSAICTARTTFLVYRCYDTHHSQTLNYQISC